MTASLVQLIVPDHLRGRVMSIYMVAFRGGMPLGSLAGGYAASLTSAPHVLARQRRAGLPRRAVFPGTGSWGEGTLIGFYRFYRVYGVAGSTVRFYGVRFYRIRFYQFYAVRFLRNSRILTRLTGGYGGASASGEQKPGTRKADDQTAAAVINRHARDFNACSFARAFTLLGSSLSARE